MKKSEIYKLALTAAMKEIVKDGCFSADETYEIMYELSNTINTQLFAEKQKTQHEGGDGLGF